MASLDPVVQIPSDLVQQLPEDVQNLIAEASNTSQNRSGLPSGTHVATFKETSQCGLFGSTQFVPSRGRVQQVGLSSDVAMDTLNKVNQEWYRIVYSGTLAPFLCVSLILVGSFIGFGAAAFSSVNSGTSSDGIPIVIIVRKSCPNLFKSTKFHFVHQHS